VTLEELLGWNQESASFWKAHLDGNPALLELPCAIDDAGKVQGLVRHIWGAELVWSQRIAGLPATERAQWPAGPLDALFEMHLRAGKIFRGLLSGPNGDWEKKITLSFAWLPPEARTPSRRKLMAHVLLHSQRHWAQLATLTRAAGFATGFLGDLIFSSALG